MSFDPKTPAIDPIIQIATATIFAPTVDQAIEADCTANAVVLTMSDAAKDGVEYIAKYAAGANPLTVITQTSANYKIELDDGTFGATYTVPAIAGTTRTWKFSRLSATTGNFLRV